MLVMYMDETEFSQEKADEALRLIRMGNVPGSFAQMIGIDHSAVERWAHDNADFAQSLEKAKHIGADAMMHECVMIADHQIIKTADKKIQIEARQQCAALWHPTRYGPQAAKTPTGGINALVTMDYNSLDPVKKALVDKHFGTDDD